MTTAKNKSRGYTLIELLIVIALMGIMASLILPRFNPSIHEELVAAAQIVSADLTYARSLAVTNNSTYRWTFDIAQNRYVLEHSGPNSLLEVLPSSPFRGNNDLPDQQITDLDELPHAGPTADLIAAQTASAAPQAVTYVEFSPLGGTTLGAATVIWLGCGSGESRRYLSVSIDPITGLASIGELQATPPLAATGTASVPLP